METTLGIVLAIIVIVFGILQIILFFKVWGMTNNVKLLRENIVAPKEDLKKDFCKWIICGNKEKAAIALMDEISNSEEFSQLLRLDNNCNENYAESIKEKLNNKYAAELKMAGLKLDLDNWINRTPL